MVERKTVQDVMTTEVVVTSPDTGVAQLAELLTFSHLRTVPVVDAQRRVVGIVSDTDLVELQPVGRLRSGRPREWQYVSREGTVGALMTTPAPTVGPESPVTDALRRMNANRVPCLPVVEVDGRLVGLITARDLMTPNRRSDSAIHADVVTVLHRYLPSLQAVAEISVVDGVVTLAGEVTAAGTIGLAVHLTRHVPGVVDVVDELHPTGYAIASSAVPADR